jgi:hypothetical protein
MYVAVESANGFVFDDSVFDKVLYVRITPTIWSKISDTQHGFSKGVVYNSSLDGDYGLQALEEICSN